MKRLIVAFIILFLLIFSGILSGLYTSSTAFEIEKELSYARVSLSKGNKKQTLEFVEKACKIWEDKGFIMSLWAHDSELKDIDALFKLIKETLNSREEGEIDAELVNLATALWHINQHENLKWRTFA